ncbi:MAG: DUF4149 domain-containing protein [Comamonadaceae bacterium]
MTRLALWLAALWSSSLGLIGFLVVPLLFARLPTPAMAGNMAAGLFQAQTWISLLCGLALLLLLSGRSLRWTLPAPASSPVFMFITAGMLLALLSEFAVSPRILARENLRLWHGIGSAMFVLQFFFASLVFWKLTPPGPGQ